MKNNSFFPSSSITLKRSTWSTTSCSYWSCFITASVQTSSCFFETTSPIALSSSDSTTSLPQSSLPRLAYRKGRSQDFLFLMFINDIALFVQDLECILFADDTTIYCASDTVNNVSAKMRRNFDQVANWTSFNRMTINWVKTKAMFISRQGITTPAQMKINNQQVEVVDEFKLLGVIINRNLDISSHVNAIKRGINTRLFSIKKIYFLPISVRLQFFKSFIQPFFGYCLSLSIYYSRSNLHQLEKLYNFCFLKLLNINLKYTAHQDQIAILKQFRLLPFRVRLYFKVSIFTYNISCGRFLDCIKQKLRENKITYNLRSKRQFVAPRIRTMFGGRRLLNFYCQAINNVFSSACKLDFKLFIEALRANFSIYSPKIFKLLNLA